MTAFAEPAERQAAAPVPSGSRRGRPLGIAAALAGLLIALVSGGLVWLNRPVTLAAGPSLLTSGPGVTAANDGFDDTKLVVDAAVGGTVQVSVENDGRLPVTILGLDTSGIAPTATQLKGISFLPRFDQPGSDSSTTRFQVARTVTLGHGDESAVLLTVRLDPCTPMSRGAAQTYDAIPVRVRRLGVTTTATIPLSLPLYVYAKTAHAPAAGCP